MSKKGKKPSEVFLSHSTRDHAFVTRLVALLRKNKIPFWYSPKHIFGAAQWHDEIGKALARCDWFLVVLTPRSVHSRWVKRELLFALNNSRYENRIVPILVRECDFQRLSWTLDQIERIDFRASFDAGCRDLLSVWGVAAKAAKDSKRASRR